MDVHVNVPSCLFSVVVNVRDMTVDRDTVSNFFKEDSSSAEILREESENVKNDDLKVLYRGHTVPLPLLLLRCLLLHCCCCGSSAASCRCSSPCARSPNTVLVH